MLSVSDSVNVESINGDLTGGYISERFGNPKPTSIYGYPRVETTSSTSSLTINIDECDMYKVTALAGTLTINAPTGTPRDGQNLVVYIKDNGTSRSLTWNAIFAGIYGIVLPSSTIVNKQRICFFIYNSATSKWDYINEKNQA